MNITRFLLYLIPCTFFTSTILAQNCQSPAGLWTSNSGAKLDIRDINPDTGQFTGSFKSPDTLFKDGPHMGTGYVGNVKEPPLPGAEQPASTVSFTVKWPDQSISSWNGYCELKDGIPSITSLWLWVRPEVNKYIEHFNTGYTIFTPYPKNDEKQPVPSSWKQG
ncbi:avidin/streptavidin family protein [Endozoicomonas atrinae]|uniref:avidin/streptavidin family protein n=1 Tax=Endozoicomonas atrinae TaxID=1333660 RepID=UPI0008261941|nr:avidin/streptavidin family protein [Endozoicomonas atrinae]